MTRSDTPPAPPPEATGPSLSRLAAAAPAPVAGAYLDGLNPPQREAVETLDGPVLVLAGAGTGKTRALTARLAHILANRLAWPSQMLAVTFTNRAAREMRHRVEDLVADFLGSGETEKLWLGTFHSLAARILRMHAEEVGLKPNFTILDADDQIRLLKQLLDAEDLDAKKWPARVLHAIIERWKDKGLRPDQLKPEDGGEFAAGRTLKLYAAYQSRLRDLNAADFGDLLLHNITLFTQHADVLEKWQDKFRYLLVDEYQDTNVAQYLWLRLLAQKHRNICCVGDDDQSIYGWRGAEVGNILKFEKDFPGAKVIRLEQNYRSTPAILAAASHLIAKNEGRLGKTLWTEVNEGDKLTLRGLWDGEEEARVIADQIEDLQRKQHLLEQIAILVRAGFQTREFEERFLTLNIPYRVIGGPRFYERKEIRDAIAYLRLINQPEDDLAFERIVNLPRRGIGDATVRALHKLARAQNVPLLAAALIIIESDELKPASRNALRRFVEMVGRFRALADTVGQVELTETVLDESGYTEMWQKDRSADAPGRLENLKELVRALNDFENLGGFLEHISLVMEAAAAAGGDMVNVMTLHASKGLEFDTVFLPGWEEGVFPHQRALDESGQAGLEEERRLAYVGMTRARTHLHLSFAANRRIHNQWQSAIPSRFIDELPHDQVEVMSQQGVYGSGAAARQTQFSAFSGHVYGGDGNKHGELAEDDIPFGVPARQGRPRSRFQAGDSAQGAGTDRYAWNKRRAKARQAPVIDAEPEWVKASKDAGFLQGERVFHDKFGYGVVKSVDGDKLEVIFEHGGRKKVVASFLEKG